MSVFDLKPITSKTIEQLKLDQSELWQIKIEDKVYGPFETRSLKHYARENAEILKYAQAVKGSQENWQSFFTWTEFAAVAHSGEKLAPESQFWINENGHLSRALSLREVEQTIERGLLTMHDEISTDHGLSWKKLGQCRSLASHFTSTTNLPPPPVEASFTRAKGVVLQFLENKGNLAPSVEDAVPSLAYIAHVQETKNLLKLEELVLSQSNEVPVTDSFKWALPAAATAMVLIGMIGFHFSSQKAEDPLESHSEVAVTESKENKPQTEIVRNIPRASRVNQAQRDPASYPPRSALTQQPVFRDSTPTHIETHSNDVGPDLRDRESAENVTEGEPRVDDSRQASSDQPSLLLDNNQPTENDSLDAAMNSISQAPPASDPIVVDQPAQEDEPAQEEAADF